MRQDGGEPYCMAHVDKKCGCALCRRSRKIRRENNLLVWGCVLAFVIVFGVSFFARSADCFWCTPTYCAFDHDCDEQAGCGCCIPQGEITGECC